MNRTSAVDVKIQAMLPPLSPSAMAVPGRSQKPAASVTTSPLNSFIVQHNVAPPLVEANLKKKNYFPAIFIAAL